MKTHEQIIHELMQRPGVRAEVERLEQEIALGKDAQQVCQDMPKVGDAASCEGNYAGVE